MKVTTLIEWAVGIDRRADGMVQLVFGNPEGTERIAVMMDSESARETGRELLGLSIVQPLNGNEPVA